MSWFYLGNILERAIYMIINWLTDALNFIDKRLYKAIDWLLCIVWRY